MSENNELDSKNLSELKQYNFCIPYYQRGYRWTEKNVEVLLNDLSKFIDEEKSTKYYLQPLAINLPNESKGNETKGSEPENDNKEKKESKKIDCKVIDGQQRLTTLFIISKYLGFKDDLYSFSYEKDDDEETYEFLREIDEKYSDKTNDENNDKHDDENNDKTDDINRHYMKNAYKTVVEWFETGKGSGYKKKFEALFKEEDKNKKNIVFLWYPVEEQDEHKVFENINSGKIQLTNSDLIKALLLCETTGLPNREQVAVQFESMERLFAKDRFWYMLNKKDVDYLKGQSRIDYLFKLQVVDTKKEYDTDPRNIFYKVMEYSKEELEQFWKDVRKKFQVLQEFYNDIDFYHYIGYLEFANSNINIGKLIEEYSKYPRKIKDENSSTKTFLNVLQDYIKELFKKDKLSDYTFNKKTNFEFQKIFVLHNIQTILARYHKLKEKKSLKFYYEYFPFELLYSKDCKWDIEHISSQTPNSVTNKQDRIIWIKNALLDNDTYNDTYIENIAKDDKEFEKFFYDQKQRYLNINVKDSSDLKPDELDKLPIEDIKTEHFEEDYLINSLGNLVLLDSHTNRSFHNSLFPKKRAIVLKASGMESLNTEAPIQYVPICTRDVYTKSYSTNINVSSLYWTLQDAKDYRNDIVKKLQVFIDEGDKIYDQL